jgi:hypothetical protein
VGLGLSSTLMPSLSFDAGPVSLSWLPSSPLSVPSSSFSPDSSSSSDSWLDNGTLACSTGWVLGCSLLEPGVLVLVGALINRPLRSLCDWELAVIGKCDT